MKTKLLIFGVTGDLSKRKLLPAISQLLKTESVQNLEIIGISRSDRKASEIYANWPNLVSIGQIFSMDLAQPKEYLKLKQFVNLTPDEQLIAYLAVPPMAATRIADYMGQAELNTPNVKIMFEKPFGIDYESAQNVIHRTERYFKEQQIYRIDHYLAKEMAQNIATIRAENALFRHIWNDSVIEKIEIIAAEKIDIEGRADFYEQTGALRDFMQGHLMQLLSLVLMEIPEEIHWSDLPKWRLAAVQKILPAKPEEAVRGQYLGYREEVDRKRSFVETFANANLRTTQENLKNTKISLITGKALDEKITKINVYLRGTNQHNQNQIQFNIQPNEGFMIELSAKKSGLAHQFEKQTLSYFYPKDVTIPDAYEQVLADAIQGHKNLFTESQEVLESWRILNPLIDAWDENDDDMVFYQKGSSIEEIVSKKLDQA